MRRGPRTLTHLTNQYKVYVPAVLLDHIRTSWEKKMPPVPGEHALPFPQNSTLTLPNPFVALSNRPFTVPVQLVLVIVGVCIVHAMTAHTPIPPQHRIGQLASMVLGPVGEGVQSFNSIVLFVIKIGRGDWPTIRRPTPPHDAISAGAMAIRVPKRFAKFLDYGPFGWTRVSQDTPVSEFGADEFNDVVPGVDTVICSLPPLSRITPGRATPPLFPTSNKLNTAFAILQLAYSVAQAYMQYEILIRVQGLSSPYLIAIPYLYMSFINMIANLVQGSYTHITVIPPVRSPTDTSPPTSVSEPLPDNLANELDNLAPRLDVDGDSVEGQRTERDAESVVLPPSDESVTEFSRRNASENSDSVRESSNVAEEFDEWMRRQYPHIELHDSGPLEPLAYFLHHSIALTVVLVWVALLTGFKPGIYPSQVFILLGLIMDPILHLLLVLQKWDVWKDMWEGLGAVVAIKLLAWGFNIIGSVSAAPRRVVLIPV
jgi:hypothetical protein